MAHSNFLLFIFYSKSIRKYITSKITTYIWFVCFRIKLFDRRCANGVSTWRKIVDIWRKRCAMRLDDGHLQLIRYLHVSPHFVTNMALKMMILVKISSLYGIYRSPPISVTNMALHVWTLITFYAKKKRDPNSCSTALLCMQLSWQVWCPCQHKMLILSWRHISHLNPKEKSSIVKFFTGGPQKCV